jgi:hypothetical protein
MEKGTSQGCPLSPLFASFVVARLLEPIDGLLRKCTAACLAAGNTGNDSQGGISHLLSFVDDTSSCVYLPNLHFLCEQVQSRGTSIGCFVSPHKTRILTSCNGTSIVPTLTTHNPSMARSLSTLIASFSTTPHPTNKAAPDFPVELITGFRLLGQPIGPATFASNFFARRIDNVKKNITSLLDNITHQQTRLRLFSQCIIQKLPHLLSVDVLFHLPTDDPNPPWKEWNGPLTSNIDSVIKAFFYSLLTTLDITPDIPEYAILLSQLGLRAGGLRLLCPRTRAAPDFVITMASACRNALRGFRIHKDLPNFLIHPTIGALFDISTNTTSNILQCFYCLLPHIAEVACAPSIPPSDSINHFLILVSPKSVQSKLKLHLNNYLSHSLYSEVFSNAPDHFHLLPSLLFSQTSYPLIGLCRSNPHNRLLNWQFDISIKHKLRLPLYPTTNQFVHVAPWLIFSMITSSNANASAKLEFTMQFATVLHMLLPQFYLPPDLSP